MKLWGFDTLYRTDYTDREIIDTARREKRIILTRDIGLLKNKAVQYGYFVRAAHPDKRIKEIVKEFRLSGKARPLTLCLECNGRIRRAAKSRVLPKLLPQTKKFYTEFYKCQSCGKVYWKGSHHKRLAKMINSIQKKRS